MDYDNSEALSIFNKVILLTIHSYLDGMVKEGEPLPKILERLRVSLAGIYFTKKFTTKEADFVIDQLSDNKEIIEIVERPVSHAIFLLELLKLWIELIPKKYRPFLNISDKKLSVGKSVIALNMIKLKHIDEEQYRDKKDIIKDSEEVAKEFIEWHLKKINLRVDLLT